jgi:hypothetical protein
MTININPNNLEMKIVGIRFISDNEKIATVACNLIPERKLILNNDNNFSYTIDL